MYSVIETGGFQHKVTLGETLRVSLLEADIGSSLEMNQVLLVSNGQNVQVGAPVVADSAVVVEILAHGKDDKVLVFKKKRRQGYRRKRGHRQWFTEVLVTEIRSGSAKEVIDEKATLRARARIQALAALKAAPGGKIVKVQASEQVQEAA